MSHYFTGRSFKNLEQQAFNFNSYMSKLFNPDCGTAACAIGHAPTLAQVDSEFRPTKRKITMTNPWTKEETTFKEPESWTAYTYRVFGLEEFSREWYWCFGPNWSNVDNTPVGAAKRIMYFIKNGVPDDWKEDAGFLYLYSDHIKTYERMRVE